MVSIVPSRFAGLKIEDDEDEVKIPKAKKNKNLQPARPEPQKKPNNKPKKPKKPQAGKINPEDWSKWQEKDNEIVDSYFEQDLEAALLMSRLEFEANKDKYISTQDDNKLGKGKKSRPLSLQEFQAKIAKDAETKALEKQKKAAEKQTNEKYQKKFFDQINVEMKDIIRKEKFKDLGAQNYESEVIIAEDKTASNARDEEEEIIDIDEVLQDNERLKDENEKLKSELETVKSKFKKICSVMKSAENKGKTDLLIEIEKLKRAQNDMQNELAVIYVELEQAKSKNSSAAHGQFKEKPSRKSVRFDASSEVSHSADKS